MRSEIKGGLAILAAAAGYSTLPILVKLALAAGARIWAIVAWRFLIGAALAWLFVGLGRRPLPPRNRVPGLMALGLVYSGDAIAYLIGLQWVPAATATLVFFTYPALVVVLAALFLGERLTLRRTAALVGLVALLATAMPITLFLVGIQHVRPARAAIFSTVKPAFTVALAALWLHERISGGQWLGGALIVAGVLWLRTERPLPRAERPVPLESP